MKNSIGRVNVARRHLLQTSSLAALGLSTLRPLSAIAADNTQLPAGNLRIIVPHAPATTPDLAARLLASILTPRIDRSVIVENRVGASGLIGYEAIAKASPDGSTIMLTAASLMTIKLLYPDAPIDPVKSFTPIAMACSTTFAFAVHPSVPAQDLPQFLAHVKSNPGRVDYASPGRGTFQHLWMEQIAQMEGLQLNHIPYKGAAGAITDVVAGHVKATILPLHAALQFQNNGRLRLLGVLSATRDPLAPTLPTLAEAGLTGFSGEPWYALLGPAGMPSSVVEIYEKHVQALLGVPETQSEFAKQGVNVRPSTAQELASVMVAEEEKWRRIATAGSLNLQAN